MARLRSGPLAAWATAWLSGQVASDEVLRATACGDGPHLVSGLEGAGSGVPLSAALIGWRRSAPWVRVALPVPGDVRGLPGPAEFRAAALDAGEAVFGGGLGLVPQLDRPSVSSAPPTVLWRAFAVDEPPPDPLSVPDAQQALAEAIREAASALLAADVAARSADAAAGLSDARRAGERVNLPPGFPPRAVQLVAQAERLHAVLELAALDPAGGAVDRTGIAVRAETLRSLHTAVRRARVAGYNAAAC